MTDRRIAASPRAARSIQRILDAAARLFGKEGYQGATMNAVAAAAGVSKGLLHYHFRSKEHLLIEAQRSTFRQIHARFEERFERGDTGMEPALEALDALWQAILDMRRWAPFMVETLSLATQDGPVRNLLDEFYEESNALLEKGIRQVFAQQLDQLAMPPERLANVVRTSIHGLLVELAWVRDDVELDRVQQTYRDHRTFFARSLLEATR